MKPIAILQADQPAVDTIILWKDDDRQIAVAYLDGQVKMTRPVETVQEALEAFGVPDGQLIDIDLPQRRVVAGNRWN